MFGLFKKKKPLSAMDELIFAIYGNPPPEKTAILDEAIEIVYEELLLGQVSKQEIVDIASGLDSGPVPYSTCDLALSVALNFFKQPDLVPQLFEAQLVTRMKALEWLQQGKVAALLVQSFEEVLYKLYKPTL